MQQEKNEKGREQNGDTERLVTIRPAVATDAPRLGHLGAALVDAHHAFDAKRFIAATDRTPVSYAGFLRGQLSSDDALLLVAQVEGNVAGYVYATVEGYDYMALRGPAGVLQDIIVDPDYRGRGIGRLLIEAVIAGLEARGCPRVVLNTAEQNAVAQRLFASVGFRRTLVEMTRELGENP